jgi:hypothetical protein
MLEYENKEKQTEHIEKCWYYCQLIQCHPSERTVWGLVPTLAHLSNRMASQQCS